MKLDPAVHSILQAIFGMGVLTFVMFFWMSFTRLPAMRRAGLKLKDAEHPEDLRRKLDPDGRKAGDNYNHLFEAPVLFYAVSLAIIIAGIADPLYAVAAWAFFGLRVMHSLVQATINKVPVRMTFYLASWAALGFMIMRGVVQL